MSYANFLGGIIMLIIGIVNLSGNGTSMIAGYNTMSAEEKAKRDIKAISRFIGGMLLANAIILIVAGILINANVFPNQLLIISWSLFVVILIVGVIYLNTNKRFKNTQ